MLRRLIETDQVPSMIFWGPPGSGKTTLARIIATQTKSHFEPISAVTAGVADLRRIVGEARERRNLYGQRTILFIDEIHRFNKAQQDVVLPHVEDGTVTLIGATTENPSFEVIGPLLSRSRVYTLNLLTPEQVETIIRRALADEERGLGREKLAVDDEADQGAGRQHRRRRAHRAERARARDVGGATGRKRRQAASRASSSKRRFSTARTCTTARARRTTTPSPPSSSRCAAPTPTPPSTGWRG